jgi:hypothetical protein
VEQKQKKVLRVVEEIYLKNLSNNKNGKIYDDEEGKLLFLLFSFAANSFITASN